MNDRIKNLDLFDANCMLGRVFAPEARLFRSRSKNSWP